MEDDSLENFQENYDSENTEFIEMLSYVLREIGDTEIDPKELTEMDEIEMILKKYYMLFDSLEPLKELLPNDIGFHDYLNNLTSIYNKEISDNLKNNEKCKIKKI